MWSRQARLPQAAAFVLLACVAAAAAAGDAGDAGAEHFKVLFVEMSIGVGAGEPMQEMVVSNEWVLFDPDTIMFDVTAAVTNGSKMTDALRARALREVHKTVAFRLGDRACDVHTVSAKAAGFSTFDQATHAMVDVKYACGAGVFQDLPREMEARVSHETHGAADDSPPLALRRMYVPQTIVPEGVFSEETLFAGRLARLLSRESFTFASAPLDDIPGLLRRAVPTAAETAVSRAAAEWKHRILSDMSEL